VLNTDTRFVKVSQVGSVGMLGMARRVASFPDRFSPPFHSHMGEEPGNEVRRRADVNLQSTHQQYKHALYLPTIPMCPFIAVGDVH